MSSIVLSDGSFVRVVPPSTDVYVDNAPNVTIVVAGEDGNPLALQEHIDNPRPHPAAESGKDFAAWFNAQTV